jgi:hypothetical protein
MIKKPITYTDYEGMERTEDFYFNLTRAELAEMELSVSGGLSKKLEKIAQTQDVPEIAAFFKEIILKAYGVKSEDGKRFIKSAQLSEEFAQTEAYVELFMELLGDPEAAAAFFNGIVPPQNKLTPPAK